MRRLSLVALIAVLAGCNLVKGPPRDHECRANLRSIIALEASYFSTHRRYSEHPADIGFAPSRGNRYAYVFAATGPLTRRDELASPPHSESVGYGPDTLKRGVLVEDLLTALPAEVRAMTGLRGECPECSITVACVGNIDDDREIDVWTISTLDRPGVARGTPQHHLDDLAPVPAEPECTLATPLEAGVPGSPGHLVASERNPNGASELATLMRRFVDDWDEARRSLDGGQPLSPRWPVHRHMRCAWPTDLGDRTPTFDALAVDYLERVRAFDAHPGGETYDAVIAGCVACHEVTCGGPLERIEKLRR